VVTLGADLVGAKGAPAEMAGAVDTHANGLLDTLHADRCGGRGDPLVGLELQSILCEQGTGPFLLESGAIELSCDGSGWRRCSGGGGRGVGRTGRELAGRERKKKGVERARRTPRRVPSFQFWEQAWTAWSGSTGCSFQISLS
jgi:hypothetical protein